MPRHADVLVPKNTWTILTDPTDATITGVRLQSLSGCNVRVQAKADASPDNVTLGGSLLLRDNEIVFSTDTLAAMFPGVTSPLHLFAFSYTDAEVSVSHA